MQERHHVKTTPGEPHASPEYAPHAVHKDVETSGNSQMDDINIPLVAVCVGFFGVLLAVTIVSLQAGFNNYQAWEIAGKQSKQEDPATPLGATLKMQRHELQAGISDERLLANAVPGTGSATATSLPAKPPSMPIDQAMALVEKRYAQEK